MTVQVLHNSGNDPMLDPDRVPTREGVLRAAAKVADILPPTPLLKLETDNGVIWCKAENLQPVGAFKIRGAWHRLSDLDEDQKRRGVVAFSSGNHAQGVAWAAQRLGMDAIILMPEDAPQAKINGAKSMGVQIITYDRYSAGREQLAADIAAEQGSVVVPSFDDPWIVEGQGSAAVEAADQLYAMTGGKFDQIIACAGGGGLTSGCALAIPDAEIVAVEPEGWDDLGQSLRLGHIVPVANDAPPTLCDALQTKQISPITFAILSARNATGISVSEGDVKAAMRHAYAKLRLVVEPGGAVALAAILSGKVKLGKTPLVTLSGGNVDPQKYAAIIGEAA